VSFRPGSREGVQKKSILVTTNDPSARDLQLEVRASVEVVLAASPSAVVFPAFASSSGSANPVYARLTGTESSTANIVAVECANKLVSVEVKRDGFDGKAERQLKFSIGPGMPVGRFREQVVLKTDSAKVGTLNLFVMGEVLGAVSITPRHLPLGTLNPGEPVRKLITLRATGSDVRFRVLGVKSSIEGITTELIEVAPGKEYQVAVGLAEGFAPPVIRGEIRITTDVPEQKTISVRVFGRTSASGQSE